MSSYLDIQPIMIPISADRQGARRHYGVHPYFTRRPYNVVRDYILHYSSEGDRVLDPFGGSGVTAIEAFLENRIGIQNDINPLANFISKGIADLAHLNRTEYSKAINLLEKECKPLIASVSDMSADEIEDLLRKLNLPPNVRLPANSDAAFYHELFSRTQLASLAILKQHIDGMGNTSVRNALLLAWSATLSKTNKTFLSAQGRAESRGGSSIFSIYRYKIARKPIELPMWDVFYDRAKNIAEAAEEILRHVDFNRRTRGWRGQFVTTALDISDLEKEFRNSVDYILTDPPYGGNISYIELSTLWNVWLGIEPSTNAKEQELIVGGELKFTESHYIKRLFDSVRSSFNMLKKNRWLSIVFQHWNVAYFEQILNAAEESNAELKAAVSQVGDPIWSMHKKKGKESVLAGEVILTFLKDGHSHKRTRTSKGVSVESIIDDILVNHQSTEIYGEYLFNLLVVQAWKEQVIDRIDISRNEFALVLKEKGWLYDQRKHCWTKIQRQNEPLFMA